MYSYVYSCVKFCVEPQDPVVKFCVKFCVKLCKVLCRATGPDRKVGQKCASGQFRQDTTPELFVLNLWRASYGEEEDVSETYAGHQVMVKTLVAWWLMGRTYGGAFGGPMVEPL